jgi:hypothetical protein
MYEFILVIYEINAGRPWTDSILQRQQGTVFQLQLADGA